MLRRAPAHALALALALALLLPAAGTTARAQGAAPAATTVTDGDVVAEIGAGEVRLGNVAVQRVWRGAPFGTIAIRDHRSGLVTGASPDFRLTVLRQAATGAPPAAVELTGADFTLLDASAAVLPRGGVAVTFELALAGDPTARVVRTVAAFPGIAGFETRTVLHLAGALTAYTLDEVVMPGAAPTLHQFSAGYDWRGSDTPDWSPTVAPFGGGHTGDHRETRSRGPGEPLEGEGEWLSVADVSGRRAFLVTQRVNYASTRGAYDGVRAAAVVDLRHDVAYLGPFEADAHLANPTGQPLRARVLHPAAPLELERVFTGLALDGDDEPWQHHRYLAGHRAPAYDRAVVFNSNGVDANRISTGAKDDMDFAEVQRQAAVARALGVETFVLDDGWQARSGDWCPDSSECPEPRHPRWPHRFPDPTFAAVRAELGTMELGLWMSPMHFHNSADAFARNPQWSCAPVGTALAGYNALQPETSSNEAGLGTWNPLATGPEGRLVDYIEGRIRRAIDVYGARYFKFDFLAWIDCAGVDPASAYDYREAFTALLDRLIAAYPEVTFQMDETNDYRLFPFESVARGPSWYANGGPKAHEALHNLWVLAPYVPSYSLGQAALGGDRGKHSTDYLMAVALPSHITFFTDLTRLSAEEVQTVRRWTDLYKAHRDRFATFAYPLLDDPLSGKGWTALQPWDAELQRGALLVYRQDDPDSVRTVALRGVRGEGRYRVTDALTGAVVGEYDAAELRAGVPVALAERHSAAVWLVDHLPGA